MGLSTTTLHLYGMEQASLAVLLPPGYLLRENNAPWLDVLPPSAGVDPRLEKLAKQATKADESATALLFDYFDDDMFRCRLYQAGKRTAKCESNGSWAKLGKQLDSLFGDKAASGAFRHASHCTDLEEALRLLEETLGTAVLDVAEEPPRTVTRSGNTLQRIKAREAELRRRPNQCVLSELSPEDWPTDWRAQLELYRRIRPFWRDNQAVDLLFGFGKRRFSVPHCPEYAVHSYTDRARQERLFCLDLRNGPAAEFPVSGSRPNMPLWITPQRELVCLFSEVIREEIGPDEWSRSYGNDFAACLRPDGSFRWRFALPDTGARFEHADTSAAGIITLYTPGESHGPNQQDAVIYQIDGQTGAILRTRRISRIEDLQALVRVDACGGFLYIAKRSEIVLLNDRLKETARWGGYCGDLYLRAEDVVGDVLWSDYDLSLYDLRTGERQEVALEVPAYVLALLPDGRLLGVNEKQNRLTVFDPAGRVISRHTALRPGMFLRVRIDAGRICVLELRAPETGALISEELFEAASLHVWRLDPV